MFSWFRRKAKQASPPQVHAAGGIFLSLRTVSGEAPPGEYAMWFASSSDEIFSASAERALIDRFYRATGGIEQDALADLLRRAGSADRMNEGVSLPEETLVFSVRRANDEIFLLSACEEKGLRCHFARSTVRGSRVEILTGLGAELAAYQAARRIAGFQCAAGEYVGAEWWEQMKQVMIGLENAQEPVQAIGKMVC